MDGNVKISGFFYPKSEKTERYSQSAKRNSLIVRFYFNYNILGLFRFS